MHRPSFNLTLARSNTVAEGRRMCILDFEFDDSEMTFTSSFPLPVRYTGRKGN